MSSASASRKGYETVAMDWQEPEEVEEKERNFLGVRRSKRTKRRSQRLEGEAER